MSFLASFRLIPIALSLLAAGPALAQTLSPECQGMLESEAGKKYLVAGKYSDTRPGKRLWYTQRLIDSLAAMGPPPRAEDFATPEPNANPAPEGADPAQEASNPMPTYEEATAAYNTQRECYSTLLDAAYQDSTDYWLDYGQNKGCIQENDKKEKVLIPEDQVGGNCTAKVRARVLKEMNYLRKLAGAPELCDPKDPNTATKRDQVCKIVDPASKLQDVVKAYEAGQGDANRWHELTGLPLGKGQECLAACTGPEYTCTPDDIAKMTKRGGAVGAVWGCMKGVASGLWSFFKGLIDIFKPSTWVALYDVMKMALTNPGKLLMNIANALGETLQVQQARLACYEQPALTEEYCKLATNIGTFLAPGKALQIAGKLVGAIAKFGPLSKLALTAKAAVLNRLGKSSKLVKAAGATTRFLNKVGIVLGDLRVAPRWRVKNYLSSGRRSRVWAKLWDSRRVSAEATSATKTAMSTAHEVNKKNVLTQVLTQKPYQKVKLGAPGNLKKDMDTLIANLKTTHANGSTGVVKSSPAVQVSIRRAQREAEKVQKLLASPEGRAIEEFEKATNAMAVYMKNPKIGGAVQRSLGTNRFDATGVQVALKQINRAVQKSEDELLKAAKVTPKMQKEHQVLLNAQAKMEEVARYQSLSQYKSFSKAMVQLQKFGEGRTARMKWTITPRIQAPIYFHQDTQLPADRKPSEDGTPPTAVEPTLEPVNCAEFVDAVKGGPDQFSALLYEQGYRADGADPKKLTADHLAAGFQLIRRQCAGEVEPADLQAADRALYKW